jgi:hypothetical protein
MPAAAEENHEKHIRMAGVPAEVQNKNFAHQSTMLPLCLLSQSGKDTLMLIV